MHVPAFLHPFTDPTQQRFLTLARAEGSTVWDDHGRAYVDGMASLWYAAVGHGRRELIDAITRQLGTLDAYHAYAPFTNVPADTLAERIAALAPMESPRVFFTSSGSEAADTAIKLARIAHEKAGEGHRDLIVSRTAGYHGVTYGGMAAQGIAPNQEGFGPQAPEFVCVDHHDLGALERVFEQHGARIAAVITEPLQGAGGVYPPPPGYLQRVRELCDAHGAFLIADEVVCAYGRLGTWFGMEHYGVRPDLITFAKAITSGYVPLGGCIVGPAVRARLESTPGWLLRHGHTYSGHPTACAAGLACLDVLENDGLLARAPRIGARLSAGLRTFVDQGRLKDVRGDGGVWAAVMRDGVDAAVVRDGMLAAGVIARPILDVIALCPPLVVTDAELDRILEAFDAALPR